MPAKYNYLNWDHMSQFVERLPQEHREEHLVQEGQLVLWPSLQAPFDALDTTSHSTVAMIILHKASWLNPLENRRWSKQPLMISPPLPGCIDSDSQEVAI